MIPQLQSGRIKALAIVSTERSPLFPDVPTFAQAGVGDDYPPTWFGLFAPAGTPRPVIAKNRHQCHSHHRGARLSPARVYRPRH